mgnify:CR=1 FL=1
MKYTEEYLVENPVTSGLAKLLSVLTTPVSAAAGTTKRVGGAAGIALGAPTIATMAQDVGLGQRQKEFILQGAKAGFGGNVRGSDTISKAVIGNLPIQSELLRTISFGAGGRPTWLGSRRRR